jgi:hypothetical protein
MKVILGKGSGKKTCSQCFVVKGEVFGYAALHFPLPLEENQDKGTGNATIVY